MFAGLAVAGEAREQHVEFGQNRGFVDVLAMQSVQTPALEVGANIRLYRPGALPTNAISAR